MSPALRALLASSDAARRQWYAAVCNRNEPEELPLRDVSLANIAAVVQQTLEEDHTVPMAMAVATTLEMYWGWTAMAGVRLDRATGLPAGFHHWNILPDMTVLEHAGPEGVRLIFPDDPEWRLYRMEWTASHHPGHPDRPDLALCHWDGRFDMEHILSVAENEQNPMVSALSP